MEEGKVIRRKYDGASKLEAIRLVKDEGRQVTEVARDLGINANLIHHWRQKLERDGLGVFPVRVKPRYPIRRRESAALVGVVLCRS